MPPTDDTGSLEKARARLYETGAPAPASRATARSIDSHTVPHVWEDTSLAQSSVHRRKKHIRVASVFFVLALLFFLVSLGTAGYFIYFGGNTVSAENITLDIQAPTTIAGGDTVPLQLTITNKNPVEIKNATIEVQFPDGTRSANNSLESYPRYIENVGTLGSGATVTRSIKAVLFGSAGQALTLPIKFSYGTTGSNSIFVKKASQAITISSTPIEVTVEALSETTSGKPLTFTLTVRSNASVPLNNVVLSGAFPFGFTPTSSSIPRSNSSFLLGTLAPGASKTITLTGSLTGQEGEERVFHFSVGTAHTPNDQTLATTYVTQDKSVTITSPFINTTFSINGNTGDNVTIAAGTRQNVTLSYANTLSTNISNVNVAVTISGTAVDYGSIQTTRGFYRSLDHTIIFSQDTDPALANLAPGASGIGSFTFSTLSAGSIASSPTVLFTTAVSGTRIGQTNVPETVSASATKRAKVLTAVLLTASSQHSAGPLSNTGPIPPLANLPTTYTVLMNVKNQGSTIADGSVSTVLPSYVTYTSKTSGSGSISYDSASRTVTWSTGNLAQGVSAQGAFQVSLTPSSSQKGTAPAVTSALTFSGYDRFAGVQVEATASAATTETVSDPGYVPGAGTVQ